MRQFKNLLFNVIISLLFFLSSQYLNGQNLQEVISTLKSELTKNPEEKRKAAIYSDLTWYYASVSVDSALQYGKKAVAATQKLNDSTMLAQIYSDLGAVHFRNNDFKNSEKNYLKSYELRKQLRNYAGLAKLNNNLASVYQSTFQYKKAMTMYLEALKFFENQNDLKNANATKANIGLLFVDLKNNGQAIKYIKEALQFFENEERTVEVENKLCENYLNLGKAYQMEKDYSSAEKFYNKSAEICSKVGNKQGFAFSKRNLGNLNTMTKKNSAAKENLKVSQIARKEFNSKLDSESNDIDIAQNLIAQGNETEAKSILLRILPIFIKEKSKENLLSTYKLLTNIYHQTRQTDSADYYFEKYIALNDDLVNTDVNRETAEMEKKYQSLKKDNEILSQKSKIFRTNVILFSLLGILLFGFIYYKNYQHKQKIKLQQEILHQQDLATKAVMTAEDTERKRMATHLHDGIGQLLTAANMNISVITDYKDDPVNFGKVLEKIRAIMSEAILDVRTLSHQIMPNMLIKNSLGDALRDLISKTTSPTLQIDLKMSGLKDSLDQNIQIVMYRIIQECINNTIKHADASKVEIAVFQENGFIEAIFKDNGKGFNPAKISSKSDGLGLDNIKSRIEMLKGELQITSNEGRGTTIAMKIPV
ncbi:tetratricopeptide repeat-containing sensor histidine kinase [Kaistella palustris]|uniref:tetratricopeptide repeat-containing sensor histidine kinase n=1 Tax=Kaistella palustris TaxID=493376 RepID=UPI00040F35C6|nr:sensor histidine kinase [Kaistella palustris]